MQPPQPVEGDIYEFGSRVYTLCSLVLSSFLLQLKQLSRKAHGDCALYLNCGALYKTESLTIQDWMNNIIIIIIIIQQGSCLHLVFSAFLPPSLSKLLPLLHEFHDQKAEFQKKYNGGWRTHLQIWNWADIPRKETARNTVQNVFRCKPFSAREFYSGSQVAVQTEQRLITASQLFS